MTQIRQATPLDVSASAALRYLPEGPCPIGPGQFSWVAIQHGPQAIRGSLNRYDLVSGINESYDLPGRPGFAFPCQSSDRFVVGCERSLGIFDVNNGRWQPFCEEVDADVDNTIINDGLVYEDNLIFGTKDLEFATRKAGLYLYRGSDQTLTRMRDDQICSNGKAMLSTSDGLRLIDIDSPTRTVVCYSINIEAATLSLPDTLLDFAADPAVPDGAILTPDGSGLIVSMFYPEVADHGETRLYDLTTGSLQCVWQTPGSPQNTCPALVQHDGSLKLIITTAVENMSESEQRACPNAGKIFIGDTDLADDGGPLVSVYPE